MGPVGSRCSSACYTPVMITLHPDIALAQLSTLGLGGRARFLCEFSEAGDLDEVMELAAAKQLPVYTLGGGSNLIVSDEGVEALVLRPLLRHWRWEHGGDDVLVTAGAGLELDELVAESTRRGLWGLENLSGIPGEMGAAPVQNVGAYGVEISELIENVEVYDFQHRCLRRLDPAACEFSYRNSIFRRNPGSFLITEIRLRLSEKAAPRLEYADLRAFDWPGEANPELVRNRILDIRREKGMLIEKSPAPPIGSVGSFFVNPILEAAEFDGIRTRTHTEIPARMLPDGRLKAAAARLI